MKFETEIITIVIFEDGDNAECYYILILRKLNFHPCDIPL